MSHARSISVLIPTYQGEEFLERLLDALDRQRIDVPWDVLVVDSGSTDRTLEVLAERGPGLAVPLRVRGIDKVEFDHGDTRNLLAAESTGELLVFLTQDAVPMGDDWLARLAANFKDERVAAAYCRNVARPDADLLTRVFAEADPGYTVGRREVQLPADYDELGPHERRVLYNFNDVASAVRRSAWERHPFPRTWFGEDILMARALLEAGHTVVYDDAATVEHSHDFTPDQMRDRARIDGRFNAEWLDRTCVATLGDAATLAERQAVIDRAALETAGVGGAELERELVRAHALRTAAFEGLYEGGRSEHRYPTTGVLERGDLHVLMVVHGFPPDTWAGTEVYTLNLARELIRRGHRVTILARTPARDGVEEFSLVRDDFEDLCVWRLVNGLAYGSLRETYDEPRAVEAFRELLLRVRPDLVHFQHLIHTSVGLVREAQAFNLPTVIHLHDYWALCSRVQMIRPNGVRCDSNRGSGCFLCVQDVHLDHIERLHGLDRTHAAELDAVAAGERPGRVLGRPGFADLRARQDVVLDAYAAADLRVSPSRFLRETLLASGAFDPHTLLFSDNGMRTDHVRALEKRPNDEGRVRFGFVGSLVWYKGDTVMVEAMNQLAGERCVLNVYGDYRPDEDEHHAELRDLASADNVQFMGRFDNQRLSEVYAEIDVLIVPSVWVENSPITIHEAFLTHTPVVTSGIGGMAEYVRDGVDGLHFAVGDAGDLARVLKRFVDEPDLVEELSGNFMQVKTIEQNARETEFRYRGLCCRRRAARPTTLVDHEGVGSALRAGECDQQGADMLLLRPGAAAEYELEAAGPGQRTLQIDIFGLGAEEHLLLGGALTLDGAAVGSIASFTSAGEDGTHRFEFELELPPGARRLRIETAKGGLMSKAQHLRVKRVVVRGVADLGLRGLDATSVGGGMS